MHAAAAIPLVRLQPASKTHALPGPQQIAHRLVCNSPGYALYAPGIVFGREPQMVRADAAHARRHDVRHGKHRFRCASAERPERGDLIIEFACGAARRQDRVDVKVERRVPLGHKFSHVRDHPVIKSGDLVRLQAEPAGHGVPAAGKDHAFACRRRDGIAKIYARYRAAGPFGNRPQPLAPAYDDSGQMEPVLEAPGHDADDTRMPALTRGDDDPPVRIGRQGALCLGGRLLLDGDFDRPALVIERMQPFGQRDRFAPVIRRQQLRRQPWVADPSPAFSRGPSRKVA